MAWSMADILASVIGTALFLVLRLLSVEQRTVKPLPPEETTADHGDQSSIPSPEAEKQETSVDKLVHELMELKEKNNALKAENRRLLARKRALKREVAELKELKVATCCETTSEEQNTSEESKGCASDESLKDSTEYLVEKFVATKDEKEALQSFDDLPRGEGPIPETVTTVIVDRVMLGEMAKRPARLELLRCLAREKRLPLAALVNALSQILKLMEYIAIDAPDAKKYFVECCSVVISESALRPSFVSMENWNRFNEFLKSEDSPDATQLKMGRIRAVFQFFQHRVHPRERIRVGYFLN